MFRFLIILSAFLLSLFVTISLPTFVPLHIARLEFKGGDREGEFKGVKTIKFGLWGFCADLNSTDVNPCDAFSPCNTTEMTSTRFCSPSRFRYTFNLHVNLESGSVLNENNVSISNPEIMVRSNMTESAPLHATSTVLLFIAMLHPYGPNLFTNIIVFAIAASAFGVIASSVEDISAAMRESGVVRSVKPGPGIFVSMTVFFLAAFFCFGTVCIMVREEEQHYNDLEHRRSRTTRGTRVGLKERVLKHISRFGAVSKNAAIDLWECLRQVFTNVTNAVRAKCTGKRSRTQARTGSKSPISLQRPQQCHLHPLRNLNSDNPSLNSLGLGDVMNPGYKCPLCLNRCTDLTSIPCGHVVCSECVITLMATDPRCPMCRMRVTRECMRKVYLSG